MIAANQRAWRPAAAAAAWALAIAVASLPAPPLAAQDLAAERWRVIGRQVERDLLDDKPVRAARTARQTIDDMVDRLAGGPDDGATLGNMLMLLAVADSALGNSPDAQWAWALAQSLDPELAAADLTRFGSPAVQLTENRLRPAAQDGQLAAEELANRPGVFERASAAEPPRELRVPEPEYPRSAHAARIEGAVIVQVLLDRQGNPRSPLILESPSPVLSYAAVEAVRRGRFDPARLDGRPVAVYYDIRVDFQR